MRPGPRMLLQATIVLWAIVVYGTYWVLYVPSR